jgi:hypothetical protein
VALVAKRYGRQRSVLCATIVKQRYLSGSRVEEGSAEIEQDGREVQHEPFARDRAPVSLPHSTNKQLLIRKKQLLNNS